MVEEAMAPKFWPLNEIAKKLLDFCHHFDRIRPPRGRRQIYDEPEILPSSSYPVCLKGAAAGQYRQVLPAAEQDRRPLVEVYDFWFVALNGTDHSSSSSCMRGLSVGYYDYLFGSAAKRVFASMTAAGPFSAVPSAPSSRTHPGLRAIADPPTMTPMLRLIESERILPMAFRRASKCESWLSEKPTMPNYPSPVTRATSSIWDVMQLHACQPLARKNL